MMTNWPLKQRIGTNFRSQLDFAQALRIHPTFVSKVVRGRRSLSEEQREQWAEALKCRSEELFKHQSAQ
jgi:transcriptional regulator with XRE-family HTH domain